MWRRTRRHDSGRAYDPGECARQQRTGAPDQEDAYGAPPGSIGGQGVHKQSE